MKVTIEFNLPEEQVESEIALNAQNFYYQVKDLHEYLRGVVKHDIPKAAKEAEKFLKLMDEYIDFKHE